MTSVSAPPASTSRRQMLPLLLAYPILAIAGALTHRPVFSMLALAVLLTALLLPRLLTRRLLPWVVWCGLLGALWLLWLAGLADVLLEAVPILLNALLAYWFGCTLATAMPRVARFIVAIEGAQRLTLPGIARYARQLTWFWTLLLGGQALLLTVLLLCVVPGGLLAKLGIASPWPLPARWVSAWLHVGAYVLIGVAFVLEYGYRRWHLRHLHHPGLRELMLQLARRWPQLLRDDGAPPP